MNNCLACGFHLAEDVDVYCGGCGCKVQQLEFSVARTVVFAGAGGNTNVALTLDNKGQSNVAVRLEWPAYLVPLNQFEMVDSLRSVVYRSSVPLTFTVDSKSIVPGTHAFLRAFVADAMVAECEVVVHPAPAVELNCTSPQLQPGRPGPGGDRDVRHFIIQDERAEDEGFGQYCFGLCLPGAHESVPVLEFRLDAGPGARMIPSQTLPFSLKHGQVLEGTLVLERGLVATLSNRAFEAKVVVSVAGLTERVFPLSFKSIPHPDVRFDLSMWGGFGEDALVRGVEDERTRTFELKNHGLAACRVLGVESDDKMVELTLSGSPNPVLAAARMSGGSAPQPEGMVEVRAVFRPDLCSAASIAQGGEAFPVPIRVRFKDDNSPHVRERMQPLTVRIEDASLMDGPLFVDFGTTNTCAAYFASASDAEPQIVPVKTQWDPGIHKDLPSAMRLLTVGAAEERPLENGVRVGPSVLTLMNTNQPKFYIRQLLSTARTFKTNLWNRRAAWLSLPRVLGLEEDLELVRFEGEALCELYLKVFFSLVSRATRKRIKSLYMTYPAAPEFTPEAKEALRRAAQRAAGLSDVGLVEVGVNEPLALAIQELTEMTPSATHAVEKYICVIDIGGGTTDVSILRARFGPEDPAPVYSILFCGGIVKAGELMTHLLARFIWRRWVDDPANADRKEAFRRIEIPADYSRQAENLAHWHKDHHEAEGAVAVWGQCLDQAKSIKHEYAGRFKDSDTTSVNIRTPNDVTFDIHKTDIDGELDAVINEIFEFVSKNIRSLSESNRLPGATVDRILLRGNGSRLSRVREHAKRLFPREEQVNFDDKLAKHGVAMGAGHAWFQRTSGAGPTEDRPVDRTPHPVGTAFGIRFMPLLPAGAATQGSLAGQSMVRPLEPMAPIFRLYEDLSPKDATIRLTAPLATGKRPLAVVNLASHAGGAIRPNAQFRFRLSMEDGQLYLGFAEQCEGAALEERQILVAKYVNGSWAKCPTEGVS